VIHASQSFHGCLHGLQPKVKKMEEEDFAREAVEFFCGHPKSGPITTDTLGAVLDRLHQAPSISDCSDYVNELDTDGSGHVDKAFFAQLIAAEPETVKQELREMENVFHFFVKRKFVPRPPRLEDDESTDSDVYEVNAGDDDEEEDGDGDDGDSDAPPPPPKPIIPPSMTFGKEQLRQIVAAFVPPSTFDKDGDREKERERQDKIEDEVAELMKELGGLDKEISFEDFRKVLQ